MGVLALISGLQAWNYGGQTFLLWEVDTSLPPWAVYEVYRDTVPITQVPQGELVGKTFASAGENYRLWDYLPGYRWRVPDTSGEMLEVPEGHAYFVYTPERPGTSYYAVRLEGADTFLASGPVAEDTGEPTAYVQYQSDTVIIFAHWIPGRGEMGNAAAAGLGFNFALWLPPGGYGPNPPLVVYLHGGTQNLMALTQYGRPYVLDGLLLTLDDPLQTLFRDTLVDQNTFWLGYRKGFDRFDPRLPSWDTVMLYTARRVWWEVSWVAERFGVDTQRVSVAGPSMGGMGTLFHTQLRPDLFAAGLSWVPHVIGLWDLTDSAAVWFIFGTKYQNLPTELEGNPGVYDLYDTRWRVANLYSPSWPPTRVVVGVNDERVPWENNAAAYCFLDSAGVGFGLFWDERGHFFDEWVGAHWYPSKFLNLWSLTQFRRSESWPGIAGFDLWPDSAGRQPDTSEEWGTWGGYVEWSGVVDSPDVWEASLWLCNQSPYPNDVCPSDSAFAYVIPKRCRLFRPSPGEVLSWALLEDGDTVAEGEVTADSLGQAWVPVVLTKSPRTLVIRQTQGLREGRWEARVRVWASRGELWAQGPAGRKLLLKLYSADGRLTLERKLTLLGEPQPLGVKLKRGVYLWRGGKVLVQ